MQPGRFWIRSILEHIAKVVELGLPQDSAHGGLQLDSQSSRAQSQCGAGSRCACFRELVYAESRVTSPLGGLIENKASATIPHSVMRRP